jgi:hypothetical protein
LYRGDSSWQFQIELYFTLVRSPAPSLPLNALPSPRKAIARGFFVLFHIGVWSPHLILLYSPFSLPQVPPQTHIVPILQYCFSLLICEWCSKEFLMYPHCGYKLLWSIQPLPLLSLSPLSSIYSFSTAFNTYPYFLYLHTCYVLDIADDWWALRLIP